MRRFSANYLLPIDTSPIKNGIITVDSRNTIVDVFNPGNSVKEFASTEFHNGVIVPGFVNTHCHLELSHLEGKISQSKGIAEFVSQVRTNRKADNQDISKSIRRAIATLKENGTAAVGDICNSLDTLSEKESSDIYFHNFIEVFGLNAADAMVRFDASEELRNSFQSSNSGTSSITPHAPYSISESLWILLKDEMEKTSPSLVSIHYGESLQEYVFLKDRAGLFAENFAKLGIPISLPDCKSPHEVVIRYIPKNAKVLFVHNTFASADEIKKLSTYFRETYFVLCPSSNLFIENALPDVPMLINSGVDIALGTDSYASSNTLSVFDQMMILLEKFPTLTFNEVLRWATLNGAKALGLDSRLGSFVAGKAPGLNLITNFDFTLMRPTSKSRVKRLV